ncbi:MAG: hypothetical protein KDC65_02475 [Saprospiraceae bacterium]|nr:hypothetical protein [Saprospiraceae bacterium]
MPPWQLILKTFIAGTERSPLPQRVFDTLGLPASPAATLEALAAASLSRKAGFLPVDSIDRSPAAPVDQRPMCSTAAQQDLAVMLGGGHAGVLPEFLEMLTKNNLRLPPEHLPALMERMQRNPELSEAGRRAAGPQIEWLAKQHPQWQGLVQDDAIDWFTASFSARKKLLRETRSRNPLLASAWLEKSWPEEKAEHKAAFLPLLAPRLSANDEPFLERAFTDRSREVRLQAARLLACLPENRRRNELAELFKQRFAGALDPDARAQYLKQTLPDISEESLLPWIALLPASEKGTWREGLLQLFVSLLPVDDILRLSGQKLFKILQWLDTEKLTAAVLDAAVLHGADEHADAIAIHLCADIHHRAWSSLSINAFLERYAQQVLRCMRKSGIAIGHEQEGLLRALENHQHPWPAELLHGLLDQYRKAAPTGEADIPGWHYSSALQTAARFCRPADLAADTTVKSYLKGAYRSRPRELEDFLGTVRFRAQMATHFAAS